MSSCDKVNGLVVSLLGKVEFVLSHQESSLVVAIFGEL